MQVNPREWHPRHQLERVLVDIHMDPDGAVTIVATGRSNTQRADLWRHTETVSADAHHLVASDVAHYFLVVAMQDRPRTAQAFQAGLVGEGWEDVPLPF